jgi:hypothetical protein
VVVVRGTLEAAGVEVTGGVLVVEEVVVAWGVARGGVVVARVTVAGGGVAGGVVIGISGSKARTTYCSTLH